MKFDEAIEFVNNKIEEAEKPFIIGVAGGSCSGKTSFAKRLEGKKLSMDDYYIGISKMVNENYDNPESQDLQFLAENLKDLKKGKAIKKPVYDFVTHDRKGYEKFGPADVVIVEGLWALNKVIKDELDFKIFIEVDSQTRLNRRIKRDVAKRGRKKEEIVKKFNELVEPMYKIHVLPTQEDADLIVGNQ